jgi:hypothetical protein
MELVLFCDASGLSSRRLLYLLLVFLFLLLLVVTVNTRSVVFIYTAQRT